MSLDEDVQTGAGHKKARTRSPNYPAIGLEKAIELIRRIYDDEDRHFAPPEAMAAHLKMSATSSSFLTTIGALKQFGLLEDKGVGSNRKLRVSELGWDICLREDGSEEWKQAVKLAAIMPRLHAELWLRYNANLPPKDDSIRFYLLKERPEGVFNKAHVDAFIDQFRQTIAFAELTEHDKLPPGETLEPEVFDSTQPPAILQHAAQPTMIQYSPPPTQAPPKTVHTIIHDSWSGPSIKFGLPRGNEVEIRLRAKLSPAEFQDLKKIFDLSALAFVDDSPPTIES